MSAESKVRSGAAEAAMDLRRVGIFPVLGAVLALAWAANLVYVAEVDSFGRELYPMTSYPMFSGSRQAYADDYRWSIVPENGSAPIVVNGRDLVDPDHSLEAATMRSIQSRMIRSIELGCSGARYQYPCTGDPQDWQVPTGYGEMWVHAARERLGLGHDPVSLTFVEVLIPVDSGVVQEEIHRPIFTYHPPDGQTVVHLGDGQGPEGQGSGDGGTP